MHKKVILTVVSLLLLVIFVLAFAVADDPIIDALNGTGTDEVLDRTGWTLSEKGYDFDNYIINGSDYLLELSPTFMNYFNGSDFETIDTTIVSSGCEYDHCVRKGVYFADFYEDYNPSGMIKFTNGESYVTYTPISLTYSNGTDEQLISNVTENSNGEASENKFVYGDLFGSGLDLQYIYNEDTLKENLIISDISNLPAPNLTGEVNLYVNFKIASSDDLYTAQEDGSGDLVFDEFSGSLEESIEAIKGVDSNENDSYYLLVPFATDSTSEFNQQISYALYVNGGDNILSVVTPYSWLNDSNLTYPVTIDPTTSMEIANTDRFIVKYVLPNGTVVQWTGGPSAPSLFTGNNYNGVQNRFKRSWVRWPISSGARALLATANSVDGFTVELFDFQELATSSNDDMQLSVVDEDYPNDFTPSTTTNYNDLFNKLDDISAGGSIWTNTIWAFSNPQQNNLMVWSVQGTTQSDAVLNNVLNNNEDFILGMSGFEPSTTTNEVQYNGLGASSNKPRLGIIYTCTQQANVCNACLDQSNGAGCDCAGECSGGFCWGTSVPSATCTNSCGGDGKFSPNGDSCCPGLQWNSISKQCFDPSPSCPAGYPDGTSAFCDCDTDNECPNNYYCRQQSGYDQCVPSPTCSGTIQVRTYDSQQNEIEGVKVYWNSTLQGSTNSAGYRDINIPSVACGASNAIEVRCANNAFCGNGNVAIDYSGENDSIQFDCSMCETNQDLFISQEDLTVNYTQSVIQIGAFNITTNLVNASVNVHSKNKNLNGLNVRFSLIGKDGLIKSTKTNTINVASNSVNSTFANLSSTDEVIYLTVQVDPDNQVSNDLKTNNYVRRVVFGRTKGYLDINTGFSAVNNKIKDFMESFVEPVNFSNAQIVYSVGRLSTYAPHSQTTSQGCAIINDQVWIEGKQLDNPYTGAICSYTNNGKTVVAAIGSDIDGEIASVKKLGSAANVYFSGNAVKPRIVIDWNDLTALGVYDFLHNSENLPNYHVNTPQFGNITEKILNGNTYDVAIRLVNTTNANPTKLRIKNVNSDFSANYKNALSANNTRPVVLSGGIFSNLEAWESANGQDGLANKLARDEGRDVWEIEMTGGPISENQSSLDYTYQNLVEDYWPATIAAVQYYTGKITLDYVGHSNGCRAALSSLKNYQTTGKSNVAWVQNLITGNFQQVSLQGASGAPIVNTFIGVACPSTLNELSIFSSATRFPYVGPVRSGDLAMNLLSNGHVTLTDYASKLILVSPPVSADITFVISLFDEDYKISRNLMDFYNDLSINGNSNFDLSGLNITKVRLYFGRLPSTQHDSIVPTEDMNRILNNITSSDKLGEVRTGVLSDHSSIKTREDIKQKIMESLR